MTNINAAKRTKRKLLSNVAYSVMLYGAPVWADQMSATGWTELLKVQRRICLRVASGYCTISREAVSVITSIAPLNLLAKERKQIHDMKSNREQTQPQKTSWILPKVPTKRVIRYLGVQLDTRLTYVEHVTTVAAGARRAAATIGKLMPYVGGPSQSKRSLLMSVMHSRLLYDTQVWADRIQGVKKAKESLSIA
ncbi:hypothetical protein QTP88_011013 [Uroleucon formosanum]